MLAACPTPLVFPTCFLGCSGKHALKEGVKDRASFLKENMDLLRSRELKLVEDGYQVIEGVNLYQVHGHTPGLQWVKIESEGEVVAFPSDLIPTMAHINPYYIMGYDLNGQQTLQEKLQFLDRAVNDNWFVIFEHDPRTIGARIRKTSSGKYEAYDVISEE